MTPFSRPTQTDRNALRLHAAHVLEISGALIERFHVRRRQSRRWVLRAEGLVSELNRSAGTEPIDPSAIGGGKPPLINSRLADPSVGQATRYQTTGETRLYLR